MTGNISSEDDTFRALSRPSVTEMVSIYQKWMRTNKEWGIEERRALFNQNGWGVQEFIIAHKKLHKKLPHD